jgi:hypothetical protein
MANDITLAIPGNPIKNGTLVVNGRFRDCATSTINVLTNGNYTDIEEEAPNLVAAIASFGNSYSTFTDISESTFSSFSGGALVIPELQSEEDSLGDALTIGAKDAIAAFVSNGGILLTFEPNSDGLYNLLNSIFGFSLDTNGVSEPINLTSSGLSLFPTAPSTITDNDGTDSLDTTTLPPDSVTIYEGDGVNQSVVTMIPYGSGKIYVMGWDWYDGAPIGNQDGGWVNLLGLVLSLSSPICNDPLSYGIKYNRYVKNTPIIADIQNKYDNRFDDPSYYYGTGNVDGGDV